MKLYTSSVLYIISLISQCPTISTHVSPTFGLSSNKTITEIKSTTNSSIISPTSNSSFSGNSSQLLSSLVPTNSIILMPSISPLNPSFSPTVSSPTTYPSYIPTLSDTSDEFFFKNNVQYEFYLPFPKTTISDTGADASSLGAQVAISRLYVAFTAPRLCTCD
jgi:hypothetical protein